MAYILNRSDNGTITVLNDGQVDNVSTSITLVGKNVSNFGDAQNENFIHLLENFAHSSANQPYSGQPRSPLRGQLWYDYNPSVNRLLVYDGASWRPLGVTMVGNTLTNTLINATASPPIPYSASQPGDLWFNTASQQLHAVINTNSETIVIGPEGVPGFGATRMTSTTMYDITGQLHPVMQMLLDGEVVGVLSNVEFVNTTTNAVPGFNKIYRGMTFKNYDSSTRYTTATSDVIFHGLHEQLDQSYPRRNVNELIEEQWNFNNNVPLVFGNTSTFFGALVGSAVTNSFTIYSPNVEFSSPVSASKLNYANGDLYSPVDISLRGNIGTSEFPFSNVYAVTLNAGSTTATSQIEGNWRLTIGSSLTPYSDLTNDLGTISSKFNTVYTKGLNAGGDLLSGSITGQWELLGQSAILPETDLGNNLGSLTKKFNTVHASSLNGLTAITGSPYVTGNISPSVNNAYSLGETGLRWAGINAVNLQASAATLSSLSATTGTVTNLSVSNSALGTLTATSGNITTLAASVASITTLNVGTTVVGTNSSTNLTALVGNINTLNASTGVFDRVTVNTGTIVLLQSTNGNISTLSATNGTITNLSASNGVVTSLTATIAKVGTLNANNGTISTLTVTNGTVGNLTVTTGGIVTFSAQNATVNNLNATTATVGSANISILSGTSANITTVNASSSITSPTGNINSVSAGRVTANTGTFTTLSGTNLRFQAILDNFSQVITKFDTDGTLAANTDGYLPTQRAVKTYVDFTKNYLQGLINALANSISNVDVVPSGTVFWSAGSTPPPGFLVCNGSEYPTSTYPNLFAVLGYTYGGNGSTTFKLPDLRGQFIRGWDAGKGVDPGRALGSYQLDEFKSHYHRVYDTASPDFGGDSNAFDTADKQNQAPHEGADTTAVGGSETRPKNVAMLPIIKI